MQPETNPEDIHTILGRFNHWADGSTAKGNGHAKAPKGLGVAGGDGGVREIPYEDAMRMMRSRRSGAARAAASEESQPVAAVEVAPAAEPIQTAPIDTALKTKVRSTEKSMRRVLRKEPMAKKVAAQAVTPAPKPKKPARKPERKVKAAAAQEFRQVLAKTVRKAKPAVKAAAQKEKGRDQRVSVRLSRTEEHRLQASAAKAGVTVSEYLRMRALEGAAEAVGGARRGEANAIEEMAAASAAPTPSRPAKSGLGDWIALLRNRFLASPGRFAERA